MPDPVDLRPAPMSYFQLIVRQFGVNDTLRGAILEGTGVSADELDDPQTEITFGQQLRQYDNMDRLFGPGWMLDAPDLWNPPAHGAIGVAAMSAPTIGVATEVVAAYLPTYASIQNLSLIREPDAIVLRYGAEESVSDAQYRTMTIGFFLAVAAGLRGLSGAAASKLRFDYMWPEPAYGAKFERALGIKMHWAAGANEIVIPMRLADAPSPLANPELHQAAVERLERDRRSFHATEGVKGRVERLLVRSDTGRLSSGETAKALGLSQRTLVRRLAEAGFNYRDLVDDELKSRARRWLDAGVLSRAEISERLGFADATGFSRACRRWFRAEAWSPRRLGGD